MSKNPYEILGVEADATQEEIKKAYKDKAKKCHPDIAKDDGEAFKDIAWAYDILSDENKKTHFDQFGSDPNSEEAMRTTIIMNSLCQIFDNISANLSPDELEKYDLIGIMRKSVQQKITDINSLIDRLNKDCKKVHKLKEVIEGRLKKLEKDKKPNFFLATLIKRIGIIQADIKGQEKLLDIANGMLDVVNDYEFNFDKEEEENSSQEDKFHRTRTINALGDWMTWGRGL